MIKRFIPTPYTVALLGGATISLIPSLAVTKLAQAFPSLKPQELGIVSEFFANGIGPLQAILFMFIIFVIPPIEELIFREWGWGLVSKYLSPERTWVFTSILFALVHLEPLQEEFEDGGLLTHGPAQRRPDLREVLQNSHGVVHLRGGEGEREGR